MRLTEGLQEAVTLGCCAFQGQAEMHMEEHMRQALPEAPPPSKPGAFAEPARRPPLRSVPSSCCIAADCPWTGRLCVRPWLQIGVPPPAMASPFSKGLPFAACLGWPPAPRRTPACCSAVQKAPGAVLQGPCEGAALLGSPIRDALVAPAQDAGSHSA